MFAKQRYFIGLIALLSLLVMGQSLAVVTMPCQLMEAEQALALAPIDHSMMAMNHSVMTKGHSMMAMHQDISQKHHLDNPQNTVKHHDCCKAQGHCSASCSTPALSYPQSFTTLSGPALYSLGYHQVIPGSPISSLYRPPIFR